MTAKHLGIVLPGRRYTAIGPALRFPVLALLEVGASVRTVAYPEDGDASSDEFHATVAAFVKGALEEQAWNRVTLVGKSLGTLAMGGLADAHLMPASTDAVWITPLFHDETLRRQASRCGWRSIMVIGTDDGSVDPEGHEAVARALGAETLCIDGGDHGLEVGHDALATIDAMRLLTEQLLLFLRS